MIKLTSKQKYIIILLLALLFCGECYYLYQLWLDFVMLPVVPSDFLDYLPGIRTEEDLKYYQAYRNVRGPNLFWVAPAIYVVSSVLSGAWAGLPLIYSMLVLVVVVVTRVDKCEYGNAGIEKAELIEKTAKVSPQLAPDNYHLVLDFFMANPGFCSLTILTALMGCAFAVNFYRNAQ